MRQVWIRALRFFVLVIDYHLNGAQFICVWSGNRLAVLTFDFGGTDESTQRARGQSASFRLANGVSALRLYLDRATVSYRAPYTRCVLDRDALVIFRPNELRYAKVYLQRERITDYCASPNDPTLLNVSQRQDTKRVAPSPTELYSVETETQRWGLVRSNLQFTSPIF